MNLRCQDNIAIFLKRCSHKEKIKIDLLLKYVEKAEINNIKHLAEVLKSSLSATSRLVNKIGYEHFKDFKNDLNFQSPNPKMTWIQNDYLMRQGIAVICSKRANATGNFLKACLSDRYDVVLFKGLTTEVGNFITKHQNRLFILVTITGDSHRVSVAITELANLVETPKVILASYALYLSIFKKYDYLRVIKPSKYKVTRIKNKWEADIAMNYLSAYLLEFLQSNLT